MVNFLRSILLASIFVCAYSVKADIDLTVSNPILNSSTFEAGNTISVDFTLNNLLGSAQSPNSYTGIYLSTNDVFDSQDIYLTSKFNDHLDAGQTETINNQVLTIPQSTPVGTYYLIFFADYDSDVIENNEQNNTISLLINVATPTPKDLTVTITSSETTVEIGNYFQVSVELSNIETGTIGPNFLGLYLSSNTTFDGDDIYLTAAIFNTGMGGNSSISVTASTCQIPSIVPAGTYYLLVRADDNYNISETNENNNIAIAAITVIPNAGNVDIQVSALSVANPLETGVLNSFSYLLKNVGTSSTYSFINTCYLSTDNILDGTDITIGTQTNYGLYGAYQATNFSGFIIPTGTLPGSYYLIYKVDSQNNITETNETNNTANFPITVISPTKDITVFSPTLSASNIELGNPVTVGYTLKNLGTGVISSVYTSILLSNDANFDIYDYTIQQHQSSILTANTDYVKSYTIDLPINYSTGNFYIIIYTDRGNGISETNENNNITVIPITVLPNLGNIDLTITAPSLLASVFSAGDLLYVGYTFNNIGTSTCNLMTKTGVYLSTDNLYSTDDILLSYADENTLSANRSYSNAIYGAKIPSATIAGNYFILIKADYDLLMTELIETNNVASQAIQVLPPPDIDLTLTNLTIQTPTITAGETLDVSITANNTGSLDADFTSISVYLSTDEILDVSDYYVGFMYTDFMGANSTYDITDYTLYTDLYTPAGNYKLLFIIDEYEYINENNETNNIASIDLEILAPDIDLTVTGIVISNNNVLANETITTDFILNNSGSLPSDYFETSIYISTKSYLDNTAIPLVQYIETYDVLAGSSVDVNAISLTIPLSLNTGNYYILYQADDDNYVNETVENNNVNYIAIHVTEVPKPDLIPYKVSFDVPVAERGSYLYLTTAIKNIGIADLVNGTISYVVVLSDDTIYDYYDDQVLANEYFIGDLAIGESINPIDRYMYINTATTLGDKYVLLIVDENYEVAENNEVNNKIIFPIEIIESGAGTVDLWVDNARSYPGLFVAGYQNEMNFNFYNAGSSSPFEFATVKIYYSEDGTLDVSDEFYNEISFNHLLLGKSTGYSSANLPVNATNGTHYLFFVVDEGGLIDESNETNNIYRFTIQVVDLNAVDLTISEASILTTGMLFAGEEMAINFNLFNSGLTEIDLTSTGVYLSKDELLDASDILLGDTIQANSLYIGFSEEYFNFKFTIPAGTLVGMYYILVKADYLNELAEFSETNNVYAIQADINGAMSIQSGSLLNKSTLLLYPNPASDIVNITLANEISESRSFKLYNSLGIKVLDTEILNENFQINTSLYEAGVYTYSISSTNEKGKLVILGK